MKSSNISILKTNWILIFIESTYTHKRFTNFYVKIVFKEVPNLNLIMYNKQTVDIYANVLSDFCYSNTQLSFFTYYSSILLYTA